MMSGLILKLRPREALMINGVIVENGGRRALLRIKTEGANVLRLRGALRPEDATTPLERACCIAQLAVGGDFSRQQAATMLRSALDEIGGEIGGDARGVIEAHIDAHDFYKAMRRLSALAAREHSPGAVSEAERNGGRTGKAAVG